MRKLLAAPLAALALLAASPANAQEEVPLIHVHSAANTNEGGGSWAWSAGGMNPVIRAKAPSPAAAKFLALEPGDHVSFDGEVPDVWEVADVTVFRHKGWPPASCDANVEVEKQNGHLVDLCLER